MFLTEDGLFRIIITSRGRNITAFQDWLRDKALPSIKAQLSINQNIMDFSKEEFGEVRTLVDGEKIWFNLNDICRALDLSNPSKVINDFPDDLTNSYPILTNGKKKINHTVKITPKGMKYFMEKIQINKAKKTQKQIIDFIQLTLFD